MLKRSPRRKPTRVNPKSRASATARLLGADTAQKMGAPATRHFCRSSKLARPLTITRWSVRGRRPSRNARSEEHTSELQSPDHLVCRLLLEKKNETLSRRLTSFFVSERMRTYQRL